MQLKRLLILVLLLLVVQSARAACTGSSPTWTSTPDEASVNSCLSSATYNDTINVSAGSATWASTLNITKGIHLMGPGRASLTITSTQNPVISIQPDATTIANSYVVQIDGFTFNGSNTAAQFISAGGAGASGTKPWRNLIIGNNKFQNEGGGSADPAIYALGGQTRGVIYSNIFDRCNMIFRADAADSLTSWNNSAYQPFSYGTSDQLFFEDNTITWSSAYTDQGNTGMVQFEEDARVVVRYNTWNFTNLSGGSEWVDLHGFQNWNGSPGSGQTGQMVGEIYGNALTGGTSGIFRIYNLRGSWGLMHNNSFTGATNPSIEINQYAAGDSGGSGCAADINPTPSGWRPEVNNSYTFNDTVNGTLTNMTAGSIGDGCGTSENSNWWNYNAACTSLSCSAGIGRGTTAPTGTCTTGVGYWVASTPTPTTSSAVIQAAHFYKCTSTNTWTNYYTPYTYPNPLRSGGTPTVGQSPTSLTFSNQAIGSTSSPQSVTVTNSGTGTLAIVAGATIAGTNASDYSIGSNTCTTNGSVVAGTSCSFAVSFVPTATGTRTANWTFTDNAAGSPHTGTVTGTGITGASPAAVTFSPTSLTFASEVINSTSSSQTVMMTNSGGSNLVLSSAVTFTGANAADFMLSGSTNCNNTMVVTPGGHCNIIISFHPTTTGAKTASWTVSDNASGSPHTGTLSGTAINPPPTNQIVFSCPPPNGCVFQGNGTITPVGTPSQSVTVTPNQINLATTGTQNFVATVANDGFNKGVTWTVTGPGCSGATCGTISATSSASGAAIIYTAPATAPTPNSVTLTATSVTNPQVSSSAMASIAVNPPPPPPPPVITVVELPAAVSVTTSATQTFTCTVTNDITNAGCDWALSGTSPQGSLSTTHTASGVALTYTAPVSTSSAVVLTATSTADATKNDTSAITVVAAPVISVNVAPKTASIAANGTQAFTATVTNDGANLGVTWAASSGGTFSSTTSASGVPVTYTAPNTSGTITITATSVANAAKSASATVTVTSSGAVTTVNTCAPNVQAAAGTNTFSCAPSQGSVVAVGVLGSSALTTSGVQAVTAGGTITNLTAGCPPSGACLSSVGGGNITMFYGIGLPSGQVQYIVANSAFGNQIQIFVFDQSNIVSFDTCVAGGSGSPSTSPGQVITTRGAGVVLAFNATLNVTAIASPFTFLNSPGGTVGGAGSAITSAAGTYAPTWTQQSAGEAMYACSFTTGFVSPIIGVSVNPAVATKVVSGTLPVTATVSNSTKGVTWTLSGSSCSGATCGTISSSSSASGVPITYTAPGSVPGGSPTVTLTAASIDDPTKLAASLITITAAPVIGVTVAPTTATLTANGTQNFSCTVTNDGGAAGCDWTLGGTSPRGSLSTAHTASGNSLTYTAGSSASAGVTLTAASTTDSTKTATANITVTAPVVSVSVAPTSVTLSAGGSTQVFTATVVNSASSVNWTVSGGGTITPASGATTTYTSPNSNSSFTATLTATSISDGTKSATATINVNSTSGTQFKCTGPCPAFPEAQGSGAESVGGRGGVVYEITNLSDASSGGCTPTGAGFTGCSFRECVQASGARTCIFLVAGLITQLSDISIGNSNLTIAGQSAPGQIILGGPADQGFTLRISTHDTIVRYLTISPDDTITVTGPDTGTVGYSLVNALVGPAIADHLSLRWAGNKSWNVTSNFGACLSDHVLQWSLSYEPHEGHPVGISTSSNDNATTSACMKNADWHHNVIVNTDHRIPEYNEFNIRWINNYTYNWSAYALQGLGATITDVINNVWDFNNLTPGSNNSGPHPIHSSNTSGSNQWAGSIPGIASFYVSGNIGNTPGNTGHTTPNADQYGDLAQSVDGEPGNEQGAFPSGVKRSTPQSASNAFPIIVDNFSSIAVAQNILLPTIGNSRHLDCTGNWVTHRDVADTRVVNEVATHGTGGFWPNGVTYTGVIYCPPGSGSQCTAPPGQSAPFALPARTSDYQDQPITNFTACTSTLHDGVPDAWRTRYNEHRSGSTVDPATGFTILEDYLDHLVP